MINMAKLKEIMAEINYCGNPVKNLLVKIPAILGKDQTDIENLEFSIMDLVLMDRELSVLLKDIFNLGIVLQTFRTTEKVWRNAPPEKRLPEWSHVKVNLFNNDPEIDDRTEELLIRRRRKDPRRDPRRRDDFDMTIPVDQEDNLENVGSFATNPDREVNPVEMRTVSPVQERDPRRKSGQKRDPRKGAGATARLDRDPRKSTSQEKDARRSSTEDRKSPSEERDPRKRISPERDPRKRISPAVQLPVITPDKVELPENRLQPLSTFPQKPNKPISKVMPMVKEMDHKDPRRRKRIPEITSDSVLETEINPQQAEPVPNVPSSSGFHLTKPSQGHISDADSDSDDGELKIDIKEPEEEVKDRINKGVGVVSKSELLKKLLPHKFGGVAGVDTKNSKKSDAGISMSVNLINKESDENEKNTILDDHKKSTGLDDSFGLWDEVYGVSETIENDASSKNDDTKAKSDPIPLVPDSVVDNPVSLPPSSKLGVNFKEFAKNMVRNTLMRPAKNSPKRIESIKPSQEAVEEKAVSEELIIDNDDLQSLTNPEAVDDKKETTEKVDVDDSKVENLAKESDDEMKQLEMSRDDCRKKIEDLEKERLELQQRELLLSLEKERDRLNKTIESEDAAQALADEIEDGEIADSEDDDDDKSSGCERNTSMESPKALEIDEHSPSPSPPHKSDIFVTIRHDTPKAVVRNKPPKIHRKGRKTDDPTSVPRNPLSRSERKSSDDVQIISSSAEEEEKSKNMFGEKSKTHTSKKAKKQAEKKEEGSSENSGADISVYKKDADPPKRKRDSSYPDRRGESISEDDDLKKERRKSKERYPKYWEEFEQQIESKKKPKQKSRSEDENAEEVNPGMFAEETVWLNNQERSNHWTRKSVQSIISGLNKTKTGHKPNIDIEVLEIPDDNNGEDCSPNQNFWGAQKRVQPPNQVSQFTNFQEKTGFTNLQEKRPLGPQQELNKRFKRNDWSHFSKTSKGSDVSDGIAGIQEIGKSGVGMLENWGAKSGKIPSLMDIHVSPPLKRPSLGVSKSSTFVGVDPSQKSDKGVESEKTCGMEFVESIKKKVSVLAESHKKKMETIEKKNESKQDHKEKGKVQDDDENAFLYFYEGDAMLHDEDEDEMEAFAELKDEDITSKLPLPVPCLGKSSKKPPENDETFKKVVPISPVVNRREVMEEAFGLGACLTKMKNDQSSKNTSPSNLPFTATAKGSLHVNVDGEVETPKPAPMITPPPPMISQAKWRVNPEMGAPPTKSEIYRHTLGLDNKNPIVALHELCQSNKWGVPKFNETEAPGGKSWSFSVFVNGKEFPSSKKLTKKKDAKQEAARICLQEIGVL